jgi:hypothetical protein
MRRTHPAAFSRRLKTATYDDSYTVKKAPICAR